MTETVGDDRGREHEPEQEHRRGDHRPAWQAWLDPRTLRHGLTLARVDATRVARRIAGRRLRLALLLVGVVPVVLGGGTAAYTFGREGGVAAVPSTLSTVAVVRGAAAVGWVGLVALVVVRAVGARGKVDNDAGVLAMAPTREVAVGRVASETALALVWALPVCAAVAGGYVLGGGEPAVLVTLPLAAVALVCSAVPLGVAGGLTVRHVATRVEVIARRKRVLAVLAFLGYLGAVVTGSLNRVVGTLYGTLRDTPLAWPGDLLLLGTPVGADPLRAGAVVPLAVCAAVTGAVGATVAGRRHWFADSVLGGGTGTDDEGGDAARPAAAGVSVRVERALASVAGRRTAAVVTLAWRRAARAPMKLVYLTYPLFGGLGLVSDAVRTGTVPSFLPAAALVFVVWAGTAAFTLNPLGDQGAALSTTLLSRVDGRRFLAAHVLAGALVAAPLGAVVVTGVAVAAGLSTRLVLAGAVGTPLAVVLAGVVGVGVGTTFPRYDAVSLTRSTDAVVPSLAAFLVHSLYLLLTTATAVVVVRPALEPLVAALVSWVLPFGLGVSAGTAGDAALLGLGLAVLAPLAAGYHVLRRFRRVTVD